MYVCLPLNQLYVNHEYLLNLFYHAEHESKFLNKIYLIGSHKFVSKITFCFYGKYIWCKKTAYRPWLVWLSGLSIVLRTKGSPVWFPVRAHAWVVGWVPSGGHVRGNHTLMFLSFSFSLPFSKNKYIKLKKKKQLTEASIWLLLSLEALLRTPFRGNMRDMKRE